VVVGLTDVQTNKSLTQGLAIFGVLLTRSKSEILLAERDILNLYIKILQTSVGVVGWPMFKPKEVTWKRFKVLYEVHI
jgi:hypothetical protein